MNFSWPLKQIWFCCLFGVVYTFYTIASQCNSICGLGTLSTWGWKKSYICSSSPTLGQGRVLNQTLQKRALNVLPRTVSPGPTQPLPRLPVFCFLFPSLACEQRGSPFHRLPRLSKGSAGTGGRRPVAGQQPDRQRTLPPGPRHIRTSPSALRACGLISPPPLL